MNKVDWRPKNWNRFVEGVFTPLIPLKANEVVGASFRAIAESAADIILRSPGVAVVDRNAGLPENAAANIAGVTGDNFEHGYAVGYNKAQADIVKAGWVKEVKCRED